jgi:tungstate transport system ATP-binding protein
MNPVLELRQATVRHRDRTTLDVSELTIGAGERLAIMGPNGSGKSTLLRALALLEPLTTGDVLFRGAVPGPGQRLAVRRRMASVFQAPLLCDTTVYRNVALGLRFRGHPRAESDARTRQWLSRLGIADLASRSARTLSGGEAQRASLARAFVVAPEVLFLDEAFGALDAPTRETLLLDLEAILRGSSVTAVFATHERAEALLLANRAAILMAGRIAQVGAPADVFAAPATEEVARFVGFENILPAQALVASAGTMDVEVSGVLMRTGGSGQVGDSGVVCIRAEDIRVARPGSVHLLSDRATLLSGAIRRVAPMGGAFRIHMDLGFELRAVVSRHAAEALALTEGGSIHATIPASAAHFIPAATRTQRLPSSNVA